MSEIPQPTQDDGAPKVTIPPQKDTLRSSSQKKDSRAVKGQGRGRHSSGHRENSKKKNHHSRPRPSEASTDHSFDSIRTVGGRGGYRPAKPKGPEIDNDVTGRELDGATSRQLRALEPRNAETVAKHLVMSGRYLEIDPSFALEHAIAASRSAGRIAAVREAVGIAAYVAENYELALRELRTHRRISGSLDHLALLVDCERALNRIPKALEMIREAKTEDLPAAVRVELALVESGIYSDQGKKAQAISALQIPQLNPKRAFEYSPRLFTAYSEALANAGRTQEAERWARLAFRAEAALGQGDFIEPEIFDIYGEDELFEPEPEKTDSLISEGDTADPEHTEPSHQQDVADSSEEPSTKNTGDL